MAAIGGTERADAPDTAKCAAIEDRYRALRLLPIHEQGAVADRRAAGVRVVRRERQCAGAKLGQSTATADAPEESRRSSIRTHRQPASLRIVLKDGPVASERTDRLIEVVEIKRPGSIDRDSAVILNLLRLEQPHAIARSDAVHCERSWHSNGIGFY